MPWPDKVWVKGKVIRSSTIGFTVDDGTGTISVLSDNLVGIGQYVVVRGNVGRSTRNNLIYPYLWDVDIHVVLFFPTITHLIALIGSVVVVGVISTSVYYYRKINQLSKKD